ncbi:MAG: acetolactate synthase [Firmicutes bacterium]|nr:acetolactate synthase [Bacillota bacterium]MBQ6294777.1 acetolactate synthase [Bacillota bacterium]MBR2099165.1 acetolactate synthase [Bacillota bacterium]MBR6969538.1 acetolactate synthase [Bacillota bacterium]
MSVKQISVFLENRPGALCEMTKVLADEAIDMRAFSLAETSEFGIARILVKDVYKAITVLKDADYITSVSEAVAVAIPDVPGGLHSVIKAVADAGINLEYMYCFLGGKSGKAFLVCKVADVAAAESALSAKGAVLVEQDELAEL